MSNNRVDPRVGDGVDDSPVRCEVGERAAVDGGVEPGGGAGSPETPGHPKPTGVPNPQYRGISLHTHTLRCSAESGSSIGIELPAEEFDYRVRVYCAGGEVVGFERLEEEESRSPGKAGVDVKTPSAL
jgi:hypothetical protein